MFARPSPRPLFHRACQTLACGLFIMAAPAAVADDTVPGTAAAEITPASPAAPPARPATPAAPAAPEADPSQRIEDLRAEADHLRDQADATYQATEADCYHRFLVNRCIDNAKSERLAMIRQARVLEAEARTLDLDKRSRDAAKVTEKAAKLGLEIGDRPTTATPPMPDVATPTMPPAARSKARPAATTTSAQNAERAKARAQAARRAETARRDRERYDARVREYEEKKARDASGR